MYTSKEVRELGEEVAEVYTNGRNSRHTFDYRGHLKAVAEFLLTASNVSYSRNKKELMLFKEIEYLNGNGDPTFWWASPLWIILYEKTLEDMPMYINVPVYGIVARWRLRIGK